MNSEFFKKMESAAFTNPFSDERVEIDRKILGASDGVTWDQLLDSLYEALAKEIDRLDVSTFDLSRRYADPEVRAIAMSVLFYVYSKSQEAFDGLIEEQMIAGDDSCKAPFALECFKELKGFGFSRDEACQYVGIFYQIRRAYYFISNGLIGDSRCMKTMRAQLWDNLFTHDISWYERCLWNRMEDFSTLLLGETGTGKGAAAAAIGRSGFIPFNPNTQMFTESFTRAFISINLSQYPEALIESELFGHRKGSFTGAIEHHEGLFARCSPHGAIFLDEIGDVSVPTQIKLLQVLQERTFSPVGSHEKCRFEGRVIAATNKSINSLRRDGSFRDDFYYRLCSDLITVPPLRQRIRESSKEQEQLVHYLMTRICGADHDFPMVEKLNESVGTMYTWPGNVRELEQAIRRTLLTGAYNGDTAASSVEALTIEEALDAGTLTAKELVQKYCIDLYDTCENYGEVARRTGLDWRTVKKHVDSCELKSS